MVFNIYQLSDGLGSPDPLALIRSFKPPQPPLPPLILESASALLDLLRHTLGHSIDFIAAAAAALPSSVIVSLVYRVTVLYAASRILPHLKRASDAGVPPFGMHDDDEPEHYGGERRLSDEEPVSARGMRDQVFNASEIAHNG